MKLNKEALLKVMILFGFGSFMLDIIYSGQISMYIHPRMNIYVLLCAIYLIIIGFFKIKDIGIDAHKGPNIFTYSIFVIAILMAITIKPATISASQDIMQNKGVSISQSDTNSSQNNNMQNNNSVNALNTQQNSTDVKLNVENGVIKIGGDNFVAYLNEIYTNPDKYKDKDIEISGFVYREKGFLENNFVLGRLYMVCCSADVQTVGIMSHFKNAKALKTQSWIDVKGTIKITKSDGENVPIIEVKETKGIDKPKNEYVYN